MPEEPDDQRDWQRTAVWMTVPFVLAVPPIIGWYLGRWLDGVAGTTPYLTYLLLLLGFAAGIREFWRLIKEYGNRS